MSTCVVSTLRFEIALRFELTLRFNLEVQLWASSISEIQPQGLSLNFNVKVRPVILFCILFYIFFLYDVRVFDFQGSTGPWGSTWGWTFCLEGQPCEGSTFPWSSMWRFDLALTFNLDGLRVTCFWRACLKIRPWGLGVPCSWRVCLETRPSLEARPWGSTLPWSSTLILCLEVQPWSCLEVQPWLVLAVQPWGLGFSLPLRGVCAPAFRLSVPWL